MHGGSWDMVVVHLQTPEFALGSRVPHVEPVLSQALGDHSVCPSVFIQHGSTAWSWCGHTQGEDACPQGGSDAADSVPFLKT